MGYKMHIYTNADKKTGIGSEGFDVSELVHDITYTTTLEGQPGTLTFRLENDPNGELEISVGNCVKFWCDECEVFLGYIFVIGMYRKEVCQVTAYDQMRYLRNHDYLMMQDMTVPELFEEICSANELKHQVLGKAKTDTQKLRSYNFADVPYFDMLSHAIMESNAMQSEKVVVSKANKNQTYKVKPGDVLWQIAQRYGTTVDELARINNIDDPDLIEVGQVLLLSDSASGVDTSEQTEGGAVKFFRYFVRDEFGTLTLNDIESNLRHKRTRLTGIVSGDDYYKDKKIYERLPAEPEALEPLVLGNKSLVTDYRYEIDIDKETYNEVHLLKSTEGEGVKGKGALTVALSKQESGAVKKWGRLLKTVKIKSGATQEEMEDYVRLSLNKGAVPSESLRIDALGYNGVYAGDGFCLDLPKLGIRQLMYVVSATHHYNADSHMMSLEVSTAAKLGGSL